MNIPEILDEHTRKQQYQHYPPRNPTLSRTTPAIDAPMVSIFHLTNAVEMHRDGAYDARSQKGYPSLPVAPSPDDIPELIMRC